MTTSLRARLASGSWPNTFRVKSNCGISMLAVTAPTPRLMNCLLVVAIGHLLLVHRKLGQAHDQVDQASNLLVDSRIGRRVPCHRITGVVLSEIVPERGLCCFVYRNIQRRQEVVDGLLGAKPGVLSQLVKRNECA